MSGISKENYLSPIIPPDVKVKDIRLVKATNESLKDIGYLITSPDDVTVQNGKFDIVPWPTKGWRALDPNTGNEAGTTEGSMEIYWEEDRLYGKNHAIATDSNHYLLGYGNFPSQSASISNSNISEPSDISSVFIWSSDYHPDGGQLFFPTNDNETIVDEHQSIASSRITTTTLDGIALDQIVNVILSFGIVTQHILTLKSIKIEQLLKNRHFPDFNLNNFCLTVGETNDQILSKDDYRKQVDAYLCDDIGTIHFRILIPIKIRNNNNNNNKQDMKIYLENNTTTVEQLLQQIDISDSGNLYLTSIDTQRIFQNNENLTNLNTQNFILLEENETCVVSIEKERSLSITDNNDNTNEVVRQRFRTSATIEDIMKENNIDYRNEQFLHENDFVPAESTPLSYFTSPIHFQLVKTILPFAVTIINTEDNNYSLTFYCSSSMSIERILEIACQLF
ncbi:unnamed protein product [Rotaria sp. Silwood2]|nr:unnamed protein product [Rotaria sp. Silwood2]